MHSQLKSLEKCKLIMLSGNIPRAFSIYQNCRPDYSCRNKNFTFNQNLSSQISQILNGCLKDMGLAGHGPAGKF